MILSRTPLRVSFAGGGSDLPSYYTKHGGAVLSTTIDKYIYIAVHRYFYPNQSLLKYSKTELVNNNDEIQQRRNKRFLLFGKDLQFRNICMERLSESKRI